MTYDHVVRCLIEYGEQTTAQLSQRPGCSRRGSVLGYHLGRLERDGIVYRRVEEGAGKRPVALWSLVGGAT